MRQRVLPIPSCLVWVFLSLLALAGRSAADELVMRNGDRLTGTVVKATKKSLEFKTPYAGKIAIQWDQVETLRTDQPVTLMLTDETVLKGKIAMDAPGAIQVETEAGLAAQTVDAASIRSINPEPWELGTGVKFSGEVNVAFEAERGNTDEDELDVDGVIRLRRTRDRFSLRGEWERDEDDGKKTSDNWMSFAKYDYFIGKKLYLSANWFMEGDEFEDLNLRASGGPAVGYQFFQGRPTSLSIEVGPTYVYEDYKTKEDNDFFSSRWFINFSHWFFDELFQYYLRNLGFQSLEKSDDTVIKTWTGLRFPLVAGFVATGEYALDWDNNPAPDKDKLDTEYRFKLGYHW